MSKSDQFRALRERQFAEPTVSPARPPAAQASAAAAAPARKCEACQEKDARIVLLEAAVARLEAQLASKRAMKATAQARWRANKAAGAAER